MSGMWEAASGLDYNWLRALHIIVVIGWMAGLLIYPRLLVYRLEAAGVASTEAMMDKAAASLRRVILVPTLALAWTLGLLLLAQNADHLLRQPWMHAKLALVVALSGYQGWMTALGRRIARGAAPLSARRLRMVNEIPFVIAIAAVILVVVQPFAR